MLKKYLAKEIVVDQVTWKFGRVQFIKQCDGFVILTFYNGKSKDFANDEEVQAYDGHRGDPR